MLPVRLGIYKSNAEALADTDFTDIDPNKMGSEIDMEIIERETTRIEKFYTDENDPKAKEKAQEYRASAIKASKMI